MRKFFYDRPKFGLVDINFAFAQMEMIDRPYLRGTPVGSLSNNDGNYIAMSPELKALGVKMGDPYFLVKHIVENKANRVSTFSTEFESCVHHSSAFHFELTQHAPRTVPYSVDEGWLDVKSEKFYDINPYLLNIKSKIRKNVQLETKASAAPTKTLCKCASLLIKKFPALKGVLEINEYNVDWALSMIPVRDLWGIGSAGALKLNKLGIKTAKDFRDYPYPEIIQKLLSVTGRIVQLELQGYSCHELDETLPKKKEISHNRTFPSAVYDKKTIREAFGKYATYAAEELRKEGSVCKEVEVFIRSDPFKKEATQYENSQAFTLPSYTLDTCKIIKASHEALDKIFIPGIQYRKVGVRLKKFQDYSEHQGSLFGLDDTPERISLMKATDRINSTYGPDTIFSWACGLNNEAEFEKIHKMKSPRMFTRMSETPHVTKTINEVIK